MRVYLAGPMTGYEDYNAAGFRRAAEAVSREGWEPVSPQDTIASHPGTVCPPGEWQVATHQGLTEAHPHQCWLRASLATMLGCDAVLMLPDWKKSEGAKLEKRVAVACGLPVHYLYPDGILLGAEW